MTDVRIVEVGPRDGLQNEKQILPTATKLELIRRLAAAGLRDIEATSFVSPKWAPQMADHAEIMKGLSRDAGVPTPTVSPREISQQPSCLSLAATPATSFGSIGPS